MIIKIITCHYAYNYGAVLQTYALCKYLNDSNNEAEVINYRPWYYKGSTKTTNKLKLVIRKAIRIPDNIKSEHVFGRFLHHYVPMTKQFKNYEKLKAASLCADIFLAGSDQIWNFNLPNGLDNAFYLKFVKTGVKASYAASLGMDYLTAEQKEFLKKQLEEFDYISVRETAAKLLLRDAGVTEAKVVMDPVYLQDKKVWETVMQKPTCFPHEKYIMVFAFNRQREIFEHGKRLAKKYGYKLISVNTFWEDVLNGVDHYYWNCSPEEFLYLIYHSECILTNSFHGLSFSLIFNKPVILFEKDDTGNSRMLDLLNNLNAEEVLNSRYKRELVIPSLNYKIINKNIEIQKQRSKKFLEDIILERK